MRRFALQVHGAKKSGVSMKATREYCRTCPLCGFEGEGHDVRKYLFSIHDHIIKEDDLLPAVGRGSRLDLTLANLKHVQGE